DKATLYVVKVANNAISCMHAFAVGTLNITSVNLAPGAAGNFSATSSDIEWYSPANAPIYGGDISSQLGVTACPKQ
ncbi:MAG TPA: hypothetical protein PKM15_08585, partial [bacterium]|nr:hypothetical protein [bacterium]